MHSATKFLGAWYVYCRRDRRLRQFRLGGIRQVPDADGALRRISRPRFRRLASRFYNACGRRPARFRRDTQPDQRLQHAAGCRTHVRMERHVANARKVVEFLGRHDGVGWVTWPERDDHPDKDLAAELLPKGPGAIFSFGIKGGRGRSCVYRTARPVLASCQCRRC